MCQRVFSLLVMILSALGALLCLAGIVGAWLLPAPVKRVVNKTFDAANAYVSLAVHSTGEAGEHLAGVRGGIEVARRGVREAIPEQRETVRQQVGDRIREILAPRIGEVRETATQIGAGLGSINTSLETFNTVHGVKLPTLTDELQVVHERIDEAEKRLQEFKEAVSGARFDGARLDEAAFRAAEGLISLEDRLGEWQGRLGTFGASIEKAKRAVSATLTLLSLAATLFFGLLGAGQISLFGRALGWFRKLRGS